MASLMGRVGLPVRKGADRLHAARGSGAARPVPAPVTKALRKEDAELLKEAASYMPAADQAELRRLLEENQKLRQAVTQSVSSLPPAALERFTAEYGRLAAEAAAAGLAVDAGLMQVTTSGPAGDAAISAAAFSSHSLSASASTSASHSSASAPAAPAASALGGAGRFHASAASASAARGFGLSSREPRWPLHNRSHSASVLVAAEPPAAAALPATAAAAAPPSSSASPSSSSSSSSASSTGPAHGSDGANGVHGISFSVPSSSVSSPPSASPSSLGSAAPAASSRGHEREVAGLPVEPVREEEEPDPAIERSRKAALRAAAAAEVESHDPPAVVVGREHWMIITVPERPVAGAPMRLYFNRAQSEKLRHRPHVALQYGFNHWELQPGEGGPGRADLAPAPLAKGDGTDFWCATIQVPEESFEVNFILHDTSGTYENNNGLDFTFAAEGGLSYEQWIDTATERAVARELARREAEAKAAEEAKAAAREAMETQARELGQRKAEDLKNSLSRLQAGGATSLTREGGAPVYRVTPATPVAGGKLRLRYNRNGGPFGRFPVPEGQSLSLLYGFNGWASKGTAVMTRVGAAATEGEDWFEAELSLPEEAVALNFVLNYYEHYDNNGGADYKVPVALPAGTTADAWAAGLAESFRQRELRERLAAATAAEEKAARAEAKKRAAQDFVKAVERRKVRHVLFTQPEVVTAGREVTVYYNPRDTPLAGRPAVYLLGGWNRWSHRRQFGPLAMQPPGEGGEHWQATVTVPKDAFKMDFVFSDVPGGEGCYDNRGGLDYHLPVEGSPVREAPLYVAHIAVEMAPIAKVGGLGDVVTALGRAVKEQGHQVEVILPRYDFFLHSPLLKDQLRYETEFDWGGTRIFVSTATVENLRVFFIEPRNGFFATPTVYGRYDDEVRFDFFCKAALEFLLKSGRQPDILHCHDWSTAHVARSFWADYQPYGLWKPRVVFTIHNLNYGAKKIAEAAHNCQKFTTVSPTYAYEVGGNPIIAPHAHKFLGIRNGIDPELWSPEDNQFLPLCYGADNVVEGKVAARQALRQRLNLTSWNDKFIVAVVSRLTGQKGVPLIKHAAWRTLERGGQFVLLGSAPDPRVQADFDALAGQMGGQDAAFCFKYDEPLSHLIYAAADMIVVPSMFEPCGLTQMIAMRYGSVPVVRHTGGLRDTVFDVDFDKERAAWELYGSSDWKRDDIDATNGFAFTGTDGGALDYALNRAIDAWYNDRAWFHSLQRRVMQQDWSWNRPAIDYIELYFAALKS